MVWKVLHIKKEHPRQILGNKQTKELDPPSNHSTVILIAVWPCGPDGITVGEVTLRVEGLIISIKG